MCEPNASFARGRATSERAKVSTGFMQRVHASAAETGRTFGQSLPVIAGMLLRWAIRASERTLMRIKAGAPGDSQTNASADEDV
jgi:hypothetical protein